MTSGKIQFSAFITHWVRFLCNIAHLCCYIAPLPGVIWPTCVASPTFLVLHCPRMLHCPSLGCYIALFLGVTFPTSLTLPSKVLLGSPGLICIIYSNGFLGLDRGDCG